jgi:hypothetical protein
VFFVGFFSFSPSLLRETGFQALVEHSLNTHHSLFINVNMVTGLVANPFVSSLQAFIPGLQVFITYVCVVFKGKTQFASTNTERRFWPDMCGLV